MFSLGNLRGSRRQRMMTQRTRQMQAQKAVEEKKVEVPSGVQNVIIEEPSPEPVPEPVVEEPVVEPSVAVEESVVEEPVVEEPVAEEPVAEDSTTSVIEVMQEKEVPEEECNVSSDMIAEPEASSKKKKNKKKNKKNTETTA